MAKITSGDLSVEVQFVDYSDEEINYHLKLTYGGFPIFNPALMAKEFFSVCEGDIDSLIPALEEVLCTDTESVLWEPALSEIELEITPHPELGLKSWNKIIGTPLSSEQEEKMRRVDDLKEMGAYSPEDFFRFQFQVCTSEFKEMSIENKGGYFGDALKLCVMVQRHQLEKFSSELEEEYIGFCKKFKITDPRNNLEERFDRAMRAICIKAKQYGVKSDTLLALIEQYKGRQAAKYILQGSEAEATAVVKLQVAEILEGKDLKLYVESLVADIRFGSLFTADEIKKAQERIAKWK